jgi:hypothetical protein
MSCTEIPKDFKVGECTSGPQSSYVYEVEKCFKDGKYFGEIVSAEYDQHRSITKVNVRVKSTNVYMDGQIITFINPALK